MGKTDEPHVRNEPQLVFVGGYVAFRSVFVLHRRRVCRRAEFEIPSPSYAAARRQNALADLFYLLREIRLEIGDPCTDGNLQYEILTFAAVEELAAAVAAALGFYFLSACKHHERVDIARTFEIHAAAVAAVGARGPARKFDLVESDGTVAAVARLYGDCYLIYEHGGMLTQEAVFDVF